MIGHLGIEVRSVIATCWKGGSGHRSCTIESMFGSVATWGLAHRPTTPFSFSITAMSITFGKNGWALAAESTNPADTVVLTGIGSTARWFRSWVMPSLRSKCLIRVSGMPMTDRRSPEAASPRLCVCRERMEGREASRRTHLSFHRVERRNPMHKRSPTFAGLLTFMLSVLLAVSDINGEQLYKDKTVTLVVGYPAGGGYDLYARLTAKRLTNHVPGSPKIRVENRPGENSLLAATWIGKAKPDGLTVGMWNSALVLREALGDILVKVKHKNYGWVGAPSKETLACVFMRSRSIKTVDDVLKKPINMGAVRAGFNTVNVPAMLNKALNTQFNVEPDFESVAKIGEAMQSGKVGGFCSSGRSTRNTVAELKRNFNSEPIVAVIHRTWDDPETKDFPTLWEVYRKEKRNKMDAKALAIIQAYVGPTLFMYPFAVPPRTSPDRLKTLRKAFADTVNDKDFVAGAEKAKLIINPMKGEEVEKQVKKILSTSDEVKKELAWLVLQQ